MGLRSLVATKSLLPSAKASKVHSDFLNLHFATFDEPAPGLQGQIPPHHSSLLPSLHPPPLPLRSAPLPFLSSLFLSLLTLGPCVLPTAFLLSYHVPLCCHWMFLFLTCPVSLFSLFRVFLPFPVAVLPPSFLNPPHWTPGALPTPVPPPCLCCCLLPVLSFPSFYSYD